jgi:hypothetical protein
MITHATIRTVLATVLLIAGSALAQDRLEITWGPKSETLTLDIGDKTGTFPQEMLEGSFPAPGAKAEFTSTSQWPVFAYRSRWSSDLKDWSEEDRKIALDIILMRCVDIANYPTAYPDKVISAQMIQAPKLGADHALTTLADKLRGQSLTYEMLTSGGGWPAPNAHITTTLKVGTSADGTTIFYADDSSEIDESLDRRAVVFAVHDTGTVVHFELRGEYVGKSRALGQGTVLSRMEQTAKYLGGRMEDYLDTPPTEADLKKYHSLNGERSAANEQGVSEPGASNFLTADPEATSLKDLKAMEAAAKEKRWLIPVCAGGITGFVLTMILIRRRRRHRAA